MKYRDKLGNTIDLDVTSSNPGEVSAKNMIIRARNVRKDMDSFEGDYGSVVIVWKHATGEDTDVAYMISSGNDMARYIEWHTALIEAGMTVREVKSLTLKSRQGKKLFVFGKPE